MVNIIEELAKIITTSIINEKIVEKLITSLEEKKVELKKQRKELQTTLEQTEKLIKDLVRARAAFFVSNELASEVGEGEESEFDLVSLLNSPEQHEQIEQLFQISLEELITRKCKLEDILKEKIAEINEISRDKEKLEKALEIEECGEDKLNDMQTKKEWTEWQSANLNNKLAKQNQQINDNRAIRKNGEIEWQRLERHLYLVRKPLPELPSKLQQLGTKIKDQFQTSKEKIKVSNQKLMAVIETKEVK